MLIPFQQHDVVEHDNIVAAPIKKLKILFYHAGGHTAWLYPAAIQLKTYIDLLYPELAERLEWLIPIQQEISDKELIKHIEQTDADVLCTSHYLWNHEFLIKQITIVRPQLKSTIKVIAGGPSIDVNNNKEFFDQYPGIDYAVYGAGEQAFADIVDHLVFKKSLIAFNTSNCAWKNDKTGKPIVADYKFVKMIETSPFVYNEELFTAMVHDAKERNASVWLPYTLTRGCPYSCTFCDWNSGLGNKVSRRKNTYQQEIDLFQKLEITNIYLSDANVGQYTEDVEMIEYFAQKNLNENIKFHVGGNFSKLKKENNLKIFHTMAQGGLVNKTLNFSVQDTNKQVLDNIDRPDVGWDVHVAMANELRNQYPHLIVKAQLIYGLPGQTPASWRQTLEQVTQQNIYPVIFLNEPLPASPAIYNPEYQRRFQYEYIHSNRILVDKTYFSKIPKKSNSFDQSDLVQMNLLSAIYSALAIINLVLCKNNLQSLDGSVIVDEFLIDNRCKNLYDNLYYNWTVENNFYYTINFSGNPTQIADLILGEELTSDVSFLKFVSNFIAAENRRAFLKMAISSEFRTTILEILSDVD
jgi:tRNA A37 methylthiotransferase MiaB